MKTNLKIGLVLTLLLAIAKLTPAGDEPTKADIPKNVTPELKALIEQTFSPDPKKRAVAAYQLGQMGEKAGPAVPFLIRLLDDDAQYSTGLSDYVHSCARESLGKVGPSAFEPLFAAQRQSSGNKRDFLISSLGTLNDERVVTVFLSLLNDPDQRVQRRAAGELRLYLIHHPSFRKLPGLTPSLVRALQHKNPIVRSCVANALGECRNPDAFEPLMKTLKDPEKTVRVAAIEALGDLGDPRARDALRNITRNASNKIRDDRDEGFAAARSFGQVCRGDRWELQFLLGDVLSGIEDVYIRRGSVLGIAKYGDDRATEVLVDILKNKAGQPYELRQSVVLAIAELQGRKAAPVLKQTALDKAEVRVVRIEAAQALVRVTEGEVDDIDIVGIVGTLDNRTYYMDPVSPLTQIAKHGKTKEIREAAQKILAQDPLIQSVPEDKSEKK